MFKNSTQKISAIIFVAVCMLLVTVLGACTPTAAFKPFSLPTTNDVDGNGGIAVRYGDYILYVNGYQSDATVANSYSDEIRVGQVVCMKVSDFEEIFVKTASDNKSSSTIAKEIAEYVRKNAKIVVPNMYYTNNTTNTALNGIYVFDGRLYYLTPNDELTAGGSKLNSQLVLKSVKLDGSEAEATRHYVFTSNSAQVLLSKVGNDVYATYVQDSHLFSLKVGDEKATEMILDKDKAADDAKKDDEKKTGTVLSNINFDKNSDGEVCGLFFTDADGDICHFKPGDSKIEIYVTNPKNDDDNNSLSINSVNNGYVYFTKTVEGTSDSKLYYANGVTEQGKETVYCDTTLTYFGYGDRIIYTKSETQNGETYYNIYSATNATEPAKLLVANENVYSITINKIEGKYLYYTANSINYKLDLDATTTQTTGEVIGNNLSTTATGWSVPDSLTFTSGENTYTYVFTLASGSVSVVKFDATTNKNSSSATITLTAEEKEKK